MGFFDTLTKVAKGAANVAGSMADKSAEIKIKAKKMQEEEMVNKSENELKKYATGSGVRAYAARLELRDRGLV
ncbi:MAG: hypothetical protein QM493_08505 [Sulfurovum sp.]